MKPTSNLIGGNWRSAADGATFESRNPARNSDVLGVYARSGAADVAQAAQAAKSAFPAWSSTPKPARAGIIAKLARVLESRKEAIAIEMTREMGKVLVEARGDVQEAIDMAWYIAGQGRLPDGSVTPSERSDIFCYARRVPMGVIGLITPWNFPIAIPSWKMLPALLAGNTIVFKPAEDTPDQAVLFVEALEEAGIPAGVVNLVTGFGEEAGAALVESPAVDAISFTGSTDTGRRIAGRCGELMKRVSCELGGKNAILVLGDADVDLAVKGALWSAFGTAGQRCTAASRLIVERSVAPQFTEALVESTRKLRIGGGADPTTEVGPVVNRTQLERIEGYVQIGRSEGAQVLTGGQILDEGDLSYGCFYAPTVFGQMERGMRIAQEEIFGPVTGIMPVASMQEALEIANSTAYGLSLSVYTRDVRRAFRAIDQLQSGIVYVNLPTSGAEIQLPFGGVKQTGNGHREAGWMAADSCTEWKSVYINYSETSELVRAQIDTQGG